MDKALLIAVGGAIGALLRWALATGVQERFGGPPPASFPIGTLGVNVLGCALLGALIAWTMDPSLTRPREAWRLALGVGLLGGFTTFSAYAVETIAMLEAGRVRAAAGYVLASNLLGVAGAFGAYRLVRALLGPGAD